MLLESDAAIALVVFVDTSIFECTVFTDQYVLVASSPSLRPIISDTNRLLKDQGRYLYSFER